MASWSELSFEIRLAILKALADNRTTAVYASVCREWQIVLEEKHFARIVIYQRQSHLKSFAEIVQGRRRKLVKHIWLHIRLKAYNCKVCMEDEEMYDKADNNATFRRAMVELFNVLSTWDKSCDLHKEGLLFELSIYSPSDMRHEFKDVNVQHNPYLEPCQQMMSPLVRGLRERDGCHIWHAGRRKISYRPAHDSLYRSTRRIKGHGLLLSNVASLTAMKLGEPSDELPKVDVVTGFLVRRQYCRQIHPVEISGLLHRLTGLQQVIYEPPSVHESDRYYVRNRELLLLEPGIPKSLKQLSIFESIDEKCDSDHLWGFNWLSTWKTNPIWPTRAIKYPGKKKLLSLDLDLARSTQHLEHFSACFIVDAKDFLAPFFSNAREPYLGWNRENPLLWEELETIALTSSLLSPAQFAVDIGDLLVAASQCAREMPKLQVMEIWNGANNLDELNNVLGLPVTSASMIDTWGRVGRHKAHGCLFRYHIDQTASPTTAIITWHSTWHHDIDPRVIRAWDQTAVQHCGRKVEVVTKEMLMDGTRFPASVLRHLKLRERIVHPISYGQIQHLGQLRGETFEER